MHGSSDVANRLPAQVVPDLEWVEADAGHELRGAGEVYARLRFKHRFKRSTIGFAQTVDERWEIRHMGWYNQRVVVWDEGRYRKVATMPLTGKWAGIPVRSESRRMITTLRWSRYETWDTEDDWVIRYHNTSDFGTRRARVEVAATVAHLPELPLLITLGWYLKVQKYSR